MTPMQGLLANPKAILSHEAHARLLSELGAIPGVQMGRRAVKADRAPDGGVVVSVEGAGWSPALHDLKIMTSLRIEAGAARDPRLLVEAFGHLLSAQRTLAGHGMDLGIATPLGRGNVLETRHVLHDRDHLELTREHGYDAARVIGDRLEDLYGCFEDGYDGGVDLCDDTVWARLVEGGCVAGFGFQLNGDMDDEDTPHFDGRTVRLPGTTIPESMAIHALGRRLGEIAEVDTLYGLRQRIEDRVIVAARNDEHEGVACVMLRVDPIPVRRDWNDDAST